MLDVRNKRTKIICTLGPATDDDETLRELIVSGMNVARLNFSHGTHEYHRRNIKRVRRISEELHTPVAILMDTKGPEIRTGLLKNHEPILLQTGSSVTITTRQIEGDERCFCVSYDRLPQEIECGSSIFVDDGNLGLRVDAVEGSEIFCTVLTGGRLGEHKGVNVPNGAQGLPNFTDQDRLDVRFSCEMQVDAIALSFTRSAATVEEIRDFCHEEGAHDILLFAKVESASAVENFDEILAASDGIMVARGDLGVEIPSAEVPHVQKSIIAQCNKHYKPVITATQMLDSMTRSPRPTRAEVNDVANAIYDGTDCVMLSGETAAGAYPVEAVRMMSDVCLQTEQYLPERNRYRERPGVRVVNEAIGYAAVETARRVGATAILCPTHSGRSARLMSVFRPRLPIFATSPSWITVRRTNFYWGVIGIKTTEQGGLGNICYNALTIARKKGLVERDDLVVITAGDPQTAPRSGDYTTSTNTCMVAQVQ